MELAMDLFCGAGGSTAGVETAGVPVVFAINHWKIALMSHAANHKRTRQINSKIENIDPLVFKGYGVNLILASPECTNHSRAKGSLPRDEQSRATAWQPVRYAKVLRPRRVIVENVVEFTRWSEYENWKRAWLEMGYGLRENIVCAADHGVRTSRTRLFVDLVYGREPKPVLPVTTKHLPVGDVIRFNAYPYTPVAEKAESTQKKVQKGIEALGPNEPFLIVYYSSGPCFQTLDRPLRTVTTRDRFGLVVPSPRGHMIRMLQPDELLAAMGFMPEYKLYGNRAEKIVQIGNAVCPDVMKAVYLANAA